LLIVAEHMAAGAADSERKQRILAIAPRNSA
jgi:hypothetical protein